MSINISKTGVINDVSKITAGIAGVVRNIPEVLVRQGGVSYKVFDKQLILDHFEIVIQSITYGPGSGNTDYTADIPTTFGTYNYQKNKAVLILSEAYLNAKVTSDARMGVEAQLYGVFTDGERETIDALSGVIISGTATRGSVSSMGGCGTQSTLIFGTSPFTSSTVTNASWNRTNSNGSKSFISVNIKNCSGTDSGYTRSLITNLSATVDDVSYPISIVL